LELNALTYKRHGIEKQKSAQQDVGDGGQESSPIPRKAEAAASALASFLFKALFGAWYSQLLTRTCNKANLSVRIIRFKLAPLGVRKPGGLIFNVTGVARRCPKKYCCLLEVRIFGPKNFLGWCIFDANVEQSEK